jgi:hypothetical protein
MASANGAKEKEKEKEDARKLAALEGMKAAFPSLSTDEARLKRFLRARDWDLKASSEMLAADLKWREAGNHLVTFDTVKSEIAKGRFFFHKHDKANRPIVIVKASEHFPDSNTTELTFKMAVFVLEEAVRRMAPGVELFCVLIDFDGFGMSNVDYTLCKMMLAALQNYYPERLGRAYLLNPPFIFRAVWAVLKGFMHENTRQKFIFLGSDWKQELLNDVDATCLPIAYAGSSTYVHDRTSGTIGI